MVVIGVDPHKGSHTAAVLDDDELVREARTRPRFTPVDSAVGLPLAATAAGWLMGGREPRGFARLAIE